MIQNVDKTVIVKNARITLTDDDGIRSTLVAFWLQRMEITDVHVLPTQTEERTKVGDGNSSAAVQVADLAVIARSELTIDCRSSLSYRRGHIPGSYFLTRANLARDLLSLPPPGLVTVIADDEAYANLLARDLRDAGYTPETYLSEFEQWVDKGREVETGYTHLASPSNNMWYDGEHMENPDDALRENRRYIEWEKTLIDDLGDEPLIGYA